MSETEDSLVHVECESWRFMLGKERSSLASAKESYFTHLSVLVQGRLDLSSRAAVMRLQSTRCGILRNEKLLLLGTLSQFAMRPGQYRLPTPILIRSGDVIEAACNRDPLAGISIQGDPPTVELVASCWRWLPKSQVRPR